MMATANNGCLSYNHLFAVDYRVFQWGYRMGGKKQEQESKFKVGSSFQYGGWKISLNLQWGCRVVGVGCDHKVVGWWLKEAAMNWLFQWHQLLLVTFAGEKILITCPLLFFDKICTQFEIFQTIPRWLRRAVSFHLWTLMMTAVQLSCLIPQKLFLYFIFHKVSFECDRGSRIRPGACQPIFKFSRSLQKRVFHDKFWSSWFDGLPFRIK